LIIRNTFVNAQLVSTEESAQQQDVVSKADLLAALKNDKRKKGVSWRDGQQIKANSNSISMSPFESKRLSVGANEESASKQAAISRNLAADEPAGSGQKNSKDNLVKDDLDLVGSKKENNENEKEKDKSNAVLNISDNVKNELKQ
jgi:hypothetical protein